jgi:phosphatidylglycerophosphatase C
MTGSTLKTTKDTLAVFDFDCTITTRDTLLPFLFSLHPFVQDILKSIKLSPVFVSYKTGLIDNHTAKEKLLTTFLNHISYWELQHKANEFAKNSIPPLIKSSALKRIQWHMTQQHRCILISAGLEVYLKPWAQAIGFSDVLATKLLINNDSFTGKIWGRNCFGPEKVNRLAALMGQDIQSLKNQYVIHAYGDSRGDRELLAAADYSYYRTMPE